MVDRDIKKSLNLLGMEIHGEDSIHPGGDKKIGDKLRGDGHSRLILAVLAGISEKREHGGDPESGSATGRIHHDE